MDSTIMLPAPPSIAQPASESDAPPICGNDNFHDLPVRIARTASMRLVCCSHSPIRIVLPNANVEMTHAISWPMAVAPSLQNPDPLGSEDYLVIADLDGGAQWARIDLAAPVQLRELETLHADKIQVVDEVSWDDTSQTVRATRQRRLGSLVLAEQGLSKPDPSMISAALLQGIRRAGLDRLAWNPELRQWRARVAFLRKVEGQESRWPNLSDEALLQTLDDWLGPYLTGLTTLDRVTQLDLTQPLHTLLSWEQSRQLERLGPHPSDGPERIERSRGVRDARSAYPSCAVARNVRLQGHASPRRWKDSGHAASFITSTPACSGHEGSLQLLEVSLSRSEKRTPWPLSQTLLARRSPHRHANCQSQTATGLIWFIWFVLFIWLFSFNQKTR